ncbi:uncharacterized protein LOC129586363 [Paramacrobiotus metropolitanus]|uniref:uncharacterized protein LOC129586363 n=1 Tax=Paramacrobiotus metropolitanus TaxID=2943436 RepID=UPI002445F2B1|nr:uncharacterized protein LOC129586363 [Paramacrobiotus metropolitanus]
MDAENHFGLSAEQGAPRDSFLEVARNMTAEIEGLSMKISEWRKEIVQHDAEMAALAETTGEKRKEKEFAVVTLEAKKARTVVQQREREKTVQKKQNTVEALEKLENSYLETQNMLKSRSRDGKKELIRLQQCFQDISRHFVQELDERFQKMKADIAEQAVPANAGPPGN